MFKESICSSLTLRPFLYSFSMSYAFTFSPFSVLVDLMKYIPKCLSKPSQAIFAKSGLITPLWGVHFSVLSPPIRLIVSHFSHIYTKKQEFNMRQVLSILSTAFLNYVYICLIKKYDNF